MTRRIAFINEKGGSGKTTLVANIATYLAKERGRRVLAIDMDPQGQLGRVLGLEVRQPRRSAIELLVSSMLGEAPSAAEPAASGAESETAGRVTGSIELPIVSTRLPNLDVIVSNKSLALFPGWTDREASQSDVTDRLARSLDGASQLTGYDFVLFDAPPSFGPLTLNILRASGEVVIPVPLTYLALDGCAQMLRTIEGVRRNYDHDDLRLTMVIPTFNRHTRLAGEILEKLRSHFPKELAQTVVGMHVKIDEAQSHGLSIFEYAPRDPGAASMASLAEELLTRERVVAPET